MKSIFLCAVAFATVAATAADAKFCDYRLSELVSAGTAVAIGKSVAVAGADVAKKAAGFYLITHSTSGAMMLGSTVAAVAALGATVVEGRCYFKDETIKDFYEVLALLAEVGKSMESSSFQLYVPPQADLSDSEYQIVKKDASFIKVINEKGAFDRYALRDLYVVNGELRHRDWGPNTRIGFVTAAVKMTGVGP